MSCNLPIGPFQKLGLFLLCDPISRKHYLFQDGRVERGEAVPAGGVGARLRPPLHPALPRRHGDRARGRQQLSDTDHHCEVEVSRPLPSPIVIRCNLIDMNHSAVHLHLSIFIRYLYVWSDGCTRCLIYDNEIECDIIPSQQVARHSVKHNILWMINFMANHLTRFLSAFCVVIGFLFFARVQLRLKLLGLPCP